MAIRDILLLGDQRLYKIAAKVSPENNDTVRQITSDLRDTLLDFRARHGFGRAIAAPQIGECYRLLYMNIAGNETVFINPTLEPIGSEMFELWDDCLSFPKLEVRVKRYTHCRVSYYNIDWEHCVQDYRGDLSELVQHEYDHLDGILAVQRAVDLKAFRLSR